MTLSQAAELDFKPKLATSKPARSRHSTGSMRTAPPEPPSPGKELLAEALSLGDGDEAGMNPMMRGMAGDDDGGGGEAPPVARPTVAKKAGALRSSR